MLLAAATIIDSAIANEAFLTSKRTNWTKPFFNNLRLRINNAITNHIGVDGVSELRQATQSLIVIQSAALLDLAELKVQIEVDFKNDSVRRNEILALLGFKTHNTNAKKGDQEALISMLFAIKTNLTSTLKTELTTKGIAPVLLDRLITYAESLKEADIFQEGKKGTRKEITATAIIEFNEIHSDVTGVAKIAKNFLRDDKARSEQFSFRKVASNLNLTSKKAKS